MEDIDLKNDIIIRLRKIEGQVKGIEKMINNECCCKDVLTQISAIRAAMNKVGGMLIENYAKNCMKGSTELELEENVDELVKTLLTFMK
ncbi:metal-sensitive transcriptional regulator [Clostridium sp. 19966]|uniref:metal-sensitive transcriptional regulator n=1 Tax=Clostridium sp. 19966 TaxID=2768166 RepID=UPI0028DE684A|nr:metal-sensitive transcriptional regulator [Clostridium sp. 19966]MDT8716250.1 metal-sensitive transcriptional regulator [Clostridium sp. 19966]